MNLKQKFFLCLEIENIFDSWISAHSKIAIDKRFGGQLDYNRYDYYTAELNTLCKMGAMVGCLVYPSIKYKMIRVFDKKGKLIIEKTTESCNYNLKEMALELARTNGFDGYADAKLAYRLCVADNGICPIRSRIKSCSKCSIMKLIDKYQLCTLGFINILHNVDKIYQTSHYKKLIKEKQQELDLRLNDFLTKRECNKIK